MSTLFWSLLGFNGILIVAAIGVFLLLGWPMLLKILTNRYVLGTIIVAVLATMAVGWWDREKESLREEGRLEERVKNEADNKAAEQKRLNENAEFDHDMLEANKILAQRLTDREKEIDRLTKEGATHVSPTANSICKLTHGFVLDHDSALPGTSLNPKVPAGAARPDDAPSGIPLSVAVGEVKHNYGECAKCVARLDACEERRYQACKQWDATYGTESGCTR